MTITDQLDVANLDLSTFSFGPISFDRYTVTPTPGQSEFVAALDLRPANNLIVKMDARLDKSTGLLTWRFTSLDADTQEPTDDPEAGFLNPNKKSPEGEGSVVFFVTPKPGLTTETEIRNKARIVFDVNAPIDTPEWLNTIDDSKPVSQVLQLLAQQPAASFEVKWSGTDSGAGVESYTVYVSENGGAFTVWQKDTPDTSAMFTGQAGRTYSFYSVARDAVSNREDAPTTPDATTAVATATPSGATLQFGQATYSVAEGTTNVVLTVTRSGDGTGEVSVGVSNSGTLAEPCVTLSGVAQQRCDFIGGLARLTFAPGETSKTFTVLIIDDVFVEGAETVQLNLTGATGGASVGAQSGATLTITDNDTASSSVNPINTVDFFVRQQYLDFLNRDPDTGGFNDWRNVLNTCGTNQGGLGSPVTCDRVQVSSGFYRSTEFTERGYFIFRFYNAVLGRLPLYTDFISDLSSLSDSQSPAEQQGRIATFIAGFMMRDEFSAKYPGLATSANAAQFVARLEELAQVSLPETIPPQRPDQPPQFTRSQLIQMMGSGQKTAAETVRAFVEQQAVYDKFFYRGFVAMQYFGYLRRDPEQAGYDDWVRVLTSGDAPTGIQPGDYRHLIFGFIYATEYRQRFGQ